MGLAGNHGQGEGARQQQSQHGRGTAWAAAARDAGHGDPRKRRREGVFRPPLLREAGPKPGAQSPGCITP